MKDSLKNTLCQILQRLGVISDWVVEQGTSGIWTYRKWNSGIAECWGKAAASTRAITNGWGNIFSAGATAERFTYPTNLFIDAPVETFSYGSNDSVVPCCTDWNTKTTSSGYQFVRGTSSNTSVQVRLYAIGLWKAFSGGVLRNAVIAMLSAISEIGGGLNENDDKSIASECVPCIASQGDYNGNDYKQWGITYSFISDIKADNRGTYNEHTSPDYLQKRCVVSDGRKCWGRMGIFALCKSGGDSDCVDNRIVTSERRCAA